MSTCREEVLSAIATLQRLSGGKPVSPAEVIREMQRVGTAFPEQTIRTEIVSRMCVDAPVHHGTVWPDLRRVGRGLYLMAAAETQEEAVSAPATALQPVPPVLGPTSRPWPWEGAVQAAFAGYLVARRWEITGSAVGCVVVEVAEPALTRLVPEGDDDSQGGKQRDSKTPDGGRGGAAPSYAGGLHS